MKMSFTRYLEIKNLVHNDLDPLVLTFPKKEALQEAIRHLLKEVNPWSEWVEEITRAFNRAPRDQLTGNYIMTQEWVDDFLCQVRSLVAHLESL